MCNISGLFYFGKPNTQQRKEMLKLARSLLLDNGFGNTDATGISLIDTHNDKALILKKGIDAPTFVNLLPEDLESKEFNLILLHNRKATNGSSEVNKNNHPFATKRTILVHNGVIADFKRMIKRRKLKPRTNCDSEIIQLIYEKKNDIKKTIRSFKSFHSLNFALYDRMLKKLYLYRDTRLILTRISGKNLFIFSSKNNITNLFFQKSQDKIFLPPLRISYEKDTRDSILYSIDFNNETISKNKCSLRDIYYNFGTSSYSYSSETDGLAEKEKEQADKLIEKESRNQDLRYYGY